MDVRWPTEELIKVLFFYLPTDAQENCFKKNIKIYIKTAPPCFGLIAIIRERIIRACQQSYSEQRDRHAPTRTL
jgi:myo-inositol catabolism protein IolC